MIPTLETCRPFSSFTRARHNYVASKRSLKRSIGGNPGIPLREVVAQIETRSNGRFDRIEAKLDRVVDEHTRIRERLARLEAAETRLWRELDNEP